MQVGQQLGPFAIDKQLGSGAMGSVVSAMAQSSAWRTIRTSGDGPATGSRLRIALTTNHATPRWVARSPTLIACGPNRMLAAATQVGDIVVFDVDRRQLVKALSGAHGWSRGVSFNRAGDLLAGAGEDGLIRVWDQATFGESARFRGDPRSVHAVAFHPDGQRLVTAGTGLVP